MSAYLSPLGNEPQVDSNGNPLVGGKIFTYLAGSTTPAATFTDSTGVTPQTNPIILNSRGCPASPIWLQSGQAYKLVITDANTVTLPPTLDNVTGINDPTLAAITDQWVLFTGTPTYIGATSFSVAGDQTLTLQVNRRVKTTNTGGTTYSTIRTSTFAAGITTVVVANSSGTLDSGLSALSYGVVSYTNGSVPVQTGQLIGVQTFFVGAVYTPTLGTASVVVEVQGAGGAGGGAAVTGAGQVAAGGGGGAGGFARSRVTSGFSGVTVTVGAGGVGAAGAVGGNGGTSSFGASASATGGSGGAVGSAASSATVTPGAAGGAGGVGSGGTIANAAGESGDYAFYSTIPASGKGGASRVGAGAPCVTNTSSAGTVSASSGAGGSGGVLLASVGAANAGGAGGNGAVIVWEYA